MFMSLPKITRFKKIWTPTPKSNGTVIYVRSTKTKEEKEAKLEYFLSLNIAPEYAYKWAGLEQPEPETLQS